MSAIDEVTEGMRVVVGGKKVGIVDFVKLADPDAGYPERQDFAPSVASVRDLLDDDELDVPQELAERMLRVGYIKVEGTGLHRDMYADAERIERVEGDTVYLTE